MVTDDRTREHLYTHRTVIAATDRVLSGWRANGGAKSFAAWACRPADADAVEAWIRKRGDMTRVRYVGRNWRPHGRAHIYVVDKGHPALV